MKKIEIFKISLLAIMTSSMVGCTEEEPLIGYTYKENNTVVNIEGSITSAKSSNARGWVLPVTVSISNTFSSNVDVEVTGTLKTGAQSVKTITIPAGKTSAQGELNIPNDNNDYGFSGIADFFSVELTAILPEKLDEGINYTISSIPLTIDIFDDMQFDYDTGVVNGRMTYLVDWDNPDINDLDAYVLGLESSETGDRYEYDIFDDTHPDGTYSVVVVPYVTGEEEIPWRVFFVYPNQKDYEIFEGVISDISSEEFYPLIEFTKTTNQDTGEVVYSNVRAL
jgi:hypothetical protein